MASILSKIMPLENIILNMTVEDKEDLFQHLGQLFENNGFIQAALATQAFGEREEAGSTGLGCGVAIPHGRIASLPAASAAFIRLASPIPFDSPDGKPVQLVIAVLVPANKEDLLLQVLSEVASRFSDSDFREAMIMEQDKAIIHTRIADKQ
jgi:PTS system nitrogen regulatory IIA component